MHLRVVKNQNNKNRTKQNMNHSDSAFSFLPPLSCSPMARLSPDPVNAFFTPLLTLGLASEGLGSSTHFVMISPMTVDISLCA